MDYSSITAHDPGYHQAFWRAAFAALRKNGNVNLSLLANMKGVEM
jgi:hypothetical protein